MNKRIRQLLLAVLAAIVLAPTAARANSCGSAYADHIITNRCILEGVCQQWDWEKNVYCLGTSDDTRCLFVYTAASVLRVYGEASCYFGTCWSWEYDSDYFEANVVKTDNCGVSSP